MKYLLFSGLLTVLLSVQAQETGLPQLNNKAPFSIGETWSFYSNNLEEERIINVYLPNTYEENTTKKYPVIYLLDGSADEDFIHIAGLVQFGNFPWVDLLPESIVVGIANVDRRRDFTYRTSNLRDRIEFPTSGGSAAFISFLGEELQPLIAQTYRTADTTTLIGQSLGGLLATEVLFKQPALFDNYLIISPSLWWDDESLLSYQPNLSAVSGKVYVGVGNEGPTMKHAAQSLFQKLKKLKVNVHFDYFKRQDHANILHQAVYQAFSVLYPKGEE